jgi:hypothetical protein
MSMFFTYVSPDFDATINMNQILYVTIESVCDFETLVYSLSIHMTDGAVIKADYDQEADAKDAFDRLSEMLISGNK